MRPVPLLFQHLVVREMKGNYHRSSWLGGKKKQIGGIGEAK